MRILHVEDDVALGDAVRMVLQQQGHECRTTHDGAKGWKVFDANPRMWDAVILDLQLPTCPGEWLLNAMTKRRPGMPILILTQADLETRLHLYEKGATMLLAKPFKVLDLVETLDAMVNFAPVEYQPR